MYVSMYLGVCVHVCVRERKREEEEDEDVSGRAGVYVCEREEKDEVNLCVLQYKLMLDFSPQSQGFIQ